MVSLLQKLPGLFFIAVILFSQVRPAQVARAEVLGISSGQVVLPPSDPLEILKQVLKMVGNEGNFWIECLPDAKTHKDLGDVWKVEVRVNSSHWSLIRDLVAYGFMDVATASLERILWYSLPSAHGDDTPCPDLTAVLGIMRDAKYEEKGGRWGNPGRESLGKLYPPPGAPGAPALVQPLLPATTVVPQTNWGQVIGGIVASIVVALVLIFVARLAIQIIFRRRA